MKRFSAFNLVSVVLGFAFLYVPILILIVYSFNESRLVTVWGGFSTKWYASLLQNIAPAYGMAADAEAEGAEAEPTSTDASPVPAPEGLETVGAGSATT